jgi:hypothetical protein
MIMPQEIKRSSCSLAVSLILPLGWKAAAFEYPGDNFQS